MTRIRTVAGSLGTAVLLSLLVATAATAALPEFSGPFPKVFTSKGSKISVETASRIKATCSAATNTGEVTGPNTGTVEIRLTGCGVSTFKCTSAGAAEGEIVTNTLIATLGYLNAAKKEVGLDNSAPPASGQFAEFSCAGVKVVVTGSVIGKVAPVNKLVKASKPFKVKFKQSKGKQKQTKFETGEEDVLSGSVNGGKSEGAGLNLSDQVIFTTSVEIKA